MIQRYIIQVIAAGLGAGGYSILFNIRRDKLLYASAGGSLAWIIYILASQMTTNAFITNMLAAAFSTLYSVIFARIKQFDILSVFEEKTLLIFIDNHCFHYMYSSLKVVKSPRYHSCKSSG